MKLAISSVTKEWMLLITPEFTSIEVYQAYADFQDIMDLTEGIIQHAAKAVKGDGPVNYQGTEIKINEPFKRVSWMLSKKLLG